VPQIGDILAGKYRLIKVLGEGGMGSVYEAKHERIGKRAAVKMLRPELATNEQLVSRFAREAEAAGAIGHPSIIDIYDIGQTDDGSLFLVMEFLEGESLGELLDRQPSLDPGWTAYVVCQVLSALDAAHAKGIIHRDLKPDNIFLVNTGQALPDIKLLDFGISKITDYNNPDNRMTATGTLMGTPYYMSPEQARGAKDIDHLADVYSMGVILYECLCGRRPFVGDNMLALVHEVVNTYPPPPTMLCPDLSPQLEQVIQYAMAKDRSSRYQSAAQMLEALLPFVDEIAVGRLTLGKLSSASVPPTRIDPSGTFRTHPASHPGLGGSQPGLHPGSHPGLRGSHPDTAMAWQAGTHPGSQGPSRAPLGLIVGAAVGAVVVLGLIVVGAVVFLGSDDSAVAAPPLPVAVQPAPREEAEAPAEETAPTPVPIKTITVTLRGVPDGAHVFIDDTPVEGTEIERQRDVLAHVIRVEHEGHQSWQQNISFEQNVLIPVTLLPVEEEAPERETHHSHRRERTERTERTESPASSTVRHTNPRQRFSDTFE